MALSAFGGHSILPQSEVFAGNASVEQLIESREVLETVKPVAVKLFELGITDYEQLYAMAYIENGREYLGAALNLNSNKLGLLLSEAAKEIGEDIAQELETPLIDTFSMGSLIEDAPKMSDKDIETIESTFENEVAAAMLDSLTTNAASAIGSSINYISSMPPVRNQASRGTCVSFALTAVHEFFRIRHGAMMDLSEQFLYYQTKQIDGAATACGTWIIAAARALSQKGQCLEHLCSYNPNPPCNDPNPPSVAARNNALNFAPTPLRLNPNNVALLKATLANQRLIAFAVPVFNSWFQSAESNRTGRITMPLPGEPRAGGHAMCLVGFQDLPGTPGGGYFILRNSWGTSWARQSPYAPGYGVIPYAYIQQYCTEAFTL